ncbi:MAG TPA: hypothetical protein VG819_13270 [Rhizomicrobium sp.]|jgi:hypothetical protein|nr:hypothetical protein [Rhizomicrobium sp.]
MVPADSSAPPPGSNQDARWKFLRDVAVFELKLALNNVHNFIQIPLTFAVAVFDLVFRHGREGERFYWLVEQGRLIDDHIDIYSIISDRERGLNRDFTVDAVLRRVEDVIKREYEKGGTAASVKNAVDRALDEMQAKTAPATKAAVSAAEKAKDAVRKAAENLRPAKDDAGDAPN